MKNPIFFPLCPLLIAVFFVACADQDEVQPQVPNGTDGIRTTADLSEALSDLVETSDIPGFAVSVIKNNTLAYQEAFGYADVQQQQPYTNRTIQHLASISKTFVGAAVAKAVEQGYFTLETEINDLLPVEVHNPKQPDARIKVKHLVTHTSGLLDNTAIYFAQNYYILPNEDLTTDGAKMLLELGMEQRNARSLETFLAEYYLEDGDLYDLDNFANTAPGSTWAYSNVATGLMAYLIETATGQSFADYVENEILRPLGMNQSTYLIDEVDRNKMAQWYFDESTPFPRYGNDSYVEGSMFTNNEDLGKYLLEMAKGLRGEAGLLSAMSYELLFDNQLSSGVVPTDFADNHGLFWIKSGNTNQHGGNSFGVSTYLELQNKGQAGYSLMTNMDATFDYATYGAIAQRIDQAIQQFIQAD